MPGQSRAGLNGYLCALVVVACLLAANPFAEIGFIDDWSYAKTAQVFADTGRVAYNETAAMVGWQALWGALFIKLFGFSFSVVRMSMLPFAAASVWLMHACLRRFGITPANAVLGTLTLGFCPLFLPLAASYMTDIGALFSILLCLYLCLRALHAESDRAAWLWLCSAAGSSVVGGTERQIAWLGTLVMVPATGWLLRVRRGVAWATALLWLGSIVFILAAMHWFAAQANIMPQKMVGPVDKKALKYLLSQLVHALLCLMLLVLPVLIAGLARVRRLPKVALLRIGSALLVMASVAAVASQTGVRERWIIPWLTPMIGNLGMSAENDELPGVREVTLGFWPRAAISLLVVAAGLALLEWLVRARAMHNRRTANGEGRTDIGLAPGGRGNDGLGWTTVFWTVGIFTASYVVLLIPPQLYALGIFDRYLLPLVPMACIVLVKFYQECLDVKFPVLSFVVLTVFAIYGVAGTHDWYAMMRAHLAAVDEVRASGVPRTSIQAGWEYDDWTEIEAVGFVNIRGLARPSGTYIKPRIRTRPCEREILSDYIPAIDAKYVVVYSPVSCFTESEFAPVSYHTWLPPFERRIYVQRVPAH